MIRDSETGILQPGNKYRLLLDVHGPLRYNYVNCILTRASVSNPKSCDCKLCYLGKVVAMFYRLTPKQRAARRVFLQANRSAMVVYNFGDDGKTEPHSIFLRREKRIENLFAQFQRHARPGNRGYLPGMVDVGAPQSASECAQTSTIFRWSRTGEEEHAFVRDNAFLLPGVRVA